MKLSRRNFLKKAAVAGAGLALTGCAPEVVRETVVVEKPVEKVVRETVLVEKPVEKVVEVTRVVEPTDTPAPEKGLARGGQLIHATSYSVDTLDPHLSFSAHVAFATLIHNYLVRHEMVSRDPVKFEVVPDLAESFGYDDPQTVVFELRQGVRFHDGSSFNAEVAKWNIERMVNHPSSVMRSALAVVESVEAPDDKTVVVRLNKPYGLLIDVLSDGMVGYGRTAMISKAAVEEFGEEAYGRHSHGTGPFKLKEWIPGDRVIMERFEEYWETGEDGKSLPYLDEVVHRYIPDLTVAAAELAAGTIHTVQEMPPSQVMAMKAVEHLEVELWDWTGLSILTGFINTRRAPFDDIRVRQALNYGMNRQGLAQVATFGLGVPASMFCAPGPGAVGWSEEAEHMYDYDPDKAKALLEEAGYADGFDTHLKGISREPDNTASQYASAVWAEAGIRCQSQALERTVWIDELIRNRDFDLGFSRYPIAGIDPFFLRNNITSDGPGNHGGVSDPVVDDLVARGEGEPDKAKRDEIARELRLHLQEQAYFFNGCRQPHVFVRNKRVGGTQADFSFPNLKAAWLSEA